jgi:hypothetical protein
MKQQNGFIDPVYATVAAGTILLLGLIFVGGPQYNVWQQSLAGKAELQKAEYTRQVAVLEAIVSVDGEPKVMINPEIVSMSE